MNFFGWIIFESDGKSLSIPQYREKMRKIDGDFPAQGEILQVVNNPERYLADHHPEHLPAFQKCLARRLSFWRKFDGK